MACSKLVYFQLEKVWLKTLRTQFNTSESRKLSNEPITPEENEFMQRF